LSMADLANLSTIAKTRQWLINVKKHQYRSGRSFRLTLEVAFWRFISVSRFLNLDAVQSTHAFDTYTTACWLAIIGSLTFKWLAL